MIEWEIKRAYVMMTEQKETKRGKMQCVIMAEQKRERRQYKSLCNTMVPSHSHSCSVLSRK